MSIEVRRHGHPWRFAEHSQSLVAVAESGYSDRGKISLPGGLSHADAQRKGTRRRDDRQDA